MCGPGLLIGIGLNVETRLAEAPIEVRKMAATLGEWDPGTLSDEPIRGCSPPSWGGWVHDFANWPPSEEVGQPVE